MNSAPGSVAIINPLESRFPTGMALAGEGVRTIFQSLGREATPSWVSPLFHWINDSLPIAPLRTLARLLAIQFVPLFLRKDLTLIFTAHQAPLWRTGRHFAIVHDLISLAYPFQHRMQTCFFLLLLPRVIEKCEQIIVISGATKAALAHHLALPKINDAAIIPSYLPRLEALQPARIYTPEQRIASRRFLFVGARYRHKNLDYALSALSILRQQGENAHFVIMGCLPSLWWKEHGGLQKLASEGWVTIVEYAGDDQLRSEYEKCTALIYTSLVEGMGLPPLEAMALGAPAICSDIPASKETCGDAAFYVDPARPETLTTLLRQMLRGELNEEISTKKALFDGVLKKFSKQTISGLWNERVR